ncbi:MAG: class I SAM-dependent methyltransferase [Thaumarchaeota archaeon]|nr:class I SAM-dependent methyltransferase [Nitrososphaerota archaeon]
MNCRSCGSNNVNHFLSLGRQPLANDFLKPDRVEKEPYYPLDLVFCTNCTLVQLSEESFVPRDILFTHYLYTSSVSGGLRVHFEQLAKKLAETIQKNAVVVDIGSNDGVLLKPLKTLGLRSVGVEPAVNLAKIANENGLETLNDFFSKRSASTIVSRYGHADVIVASNVFAHLDGIHEFISNVRTLLKDDGFFVIEIQYLADTINDMTYDNVYHEHVFYYSLHSLIRLFEKHNMRVFKAEHVKTHGGSLRVYICKDDRDIDRSVEQFITREKQMRLDKFETYRSFADELMKRIRELRNLFSELKEEHKFVAGYGAPAKSSTMINSVKLDATLIQYIVEDAPLKQGLFTPGSHIPIVSPVALEQKTPDYIVIFAWNYADDIMKKLDKFKRKGTKFIVPMPKVQIIK